MELMLWLFQSQNFGVGMLYNVVSTSGNDYFLKKRFFVVNLSQAIAAVVAVLVPWAVNWTAETYGFRGTLILISAVSLQSFVASALMQPVKWHLKKVYVTPETTELLVVAQDQNTEVESIQCVEQLKLDSLSNEFPCVDINIDSLPTTCKGNELLLNTKNFFDWPFLKKFVRTCTCVGVPFNLNADVIFTIFVPQALYALNWTKVEVALAISLLSFGDIATRVFLTIGSTWLKNVGNHLIYIIGMAVDVLAKLVLMWSTNGTVSYVSLILIGCSRSILVVILPLVFSDVLPPEQYARGFGLSMLFYGLIALALGPAIGAVRDATNDYTIMFYILNSIMAAVTIAWSIELFHNRKAQKVVL
ncbi:monocarboxylate transporter 12-like isoform X2 [Choristoneura fumiferana]|uniref:monocarboxylate transporter 12-like isoform X2 n=1 Tax=Choristoneura fumiferana TaxID=7141 RepID=UPI003D15DDAF